MNNLQQYVSKTIIYFLNMISIKHLIKITNKNHLIIDYIEEVYSYLIKENKKNFLLKFIDNFLFKENHILKNMFVFEFGL